MSIALLFVVSDKSELQPVRRYVILTRSFGPCRAEPGRKGIPFKGLGDFSDFDAICQWFGLRIDLRAADDPDLFRLRAEFQRIGQAGDGFGPRFMPARLPR